MSSGFALALKNERKRLGLTQAQVATGCGMSRVAITQYENGNGSPSIDLIEPLAKLGFDISKLLNLETESNLSRDGIKAEIDISNHEMAKRLVSSLPNLAGLPREKLHLVMDSYLSVLKELSSTSYENPLMDKGSTPNQ